MTINFTTTIKASKGIVTIITVMIKRDTKIITVSGITGYRSFHSLAHYVIKLTKLAYIYFWGNSIGWCTFWRSMDIYPLGWQVDDGTLVYLHINNHAYICNTAHLEYMLACKHLSNWYIFVLEPDLYLTATLVLIAGLVFSNWMKWYLYISDESLSLRQKRIF